MDVWVRSWNHVAQLYGYGSAIRKVMYTTIAMESVNSSFRKVTNKGAFPNDNALLKLWFLRGKELQKKWQGRRVSNWSLVRNQLEVNEGIKQRIINTTTRNYNLMRKMPFP